MARVRTHLSTGQTGLAHKVFGDDSFPGQNGMHVYCASVSVSVHFYASVYQGYCNNW